MGGCLFVYLFKASLDHMLELSTQPKRYLFIASPRYLFLTMLSVCQLNLLYTLLHHYTHFCAAINEPNLLQSTDRPTNYKSLPGPQDGLIHLLFLDFLKIVNVDLGQFNTLRCDSLYDDRVCLVSKLI